LNEGATVHFCARNGTDVTSTERSLREAHGGDRVHGTAFDITDAGSLTSFVDKAAKTGSSGTDKDQSGGIDIVVANASALAVADDDAAWNSAFNTDLLSTVHLIAAAMPHLIARKGVAIAISSVSGRDIDFTAPSAYGAIKAGLIHYMAQIARTYAPKGVRAVTVSPGNIYLEDGVWGTIEKENPTLFKSQFEANPMGRMGRVEEIADVVCFLGSNKASFVSGGNVTVDGALCTGVQL